MQLESRGMPAFQLGNLTAKLPIVQGGMAVGVSMSGLASAVANGGGIGVIATAGIGMFEPDFYTNCQEACLRALRSEIRKARQLTNGILGVNIMVALTNYADMVRTAAEEGIDVIFSGAGLPLDLPGLVKNACTKLVPIVSSGRAARIICKKWWDEFKVLPDAFVVEGPKAGGHLGFKAEELELEQNRLENLVPDVVSTVKPFEAMLSRRIPVIAAGGVFNGRDIYRMLKLGASAVQMGTRFVATEECDAHPLFKQAYVEAKKKDVVIIKSPVGLPGRAIYNRFLQGVSEGRRKPVQCPYHCVRTCDYKISPYCIFHALVNAQRGLLSTGFAFCGANVARIRKITTVGRLLKQLAREYTAAARSGTDAALGAAETLCIPSGGAGPPLGVTV